MHKKILAVILVLLLAVSASASEAESESEFVEGDVVVVLKSTSDSSLSAAAADFAGFFGAAVKEYYPSLSESSGQIFMTLHSDNMDALELSNALLKDSKVLAASPNYKVHAAVVPNDPRYGDCWGMSNINAPSAWNTSTGSGNVYVAIIDTGIDYSNPDLAANVDTSLAHRTISGNSDNAFDDYGHGTHVAGTIGAVGNNGIGIAGVNWNVKMIPVKALDSSGNGTVASVMSAMNYVTDLINSGVNIRALNLSLETYINLAPNHDNLVQFPLWRAFKAVDDTNKAVIVVAAGNQGETVGQPSTHANGSMIPGAGYYCYPASFTGLYNMISVSAVERDSNTGATQLASFSNKGANISAPGVNILSTWLQNDTSSIGSDGVSLSSKQGTSMAVPHVVGAAALVSSAFPSATAYQIRQTLLIGSALDVSASLSYASSSLSLLSSKGTEWSAYDDYKLYEEQGERSSYSSDGGSSSGGCSGIQFGIAGTFVVIMLARKRMSW